MAVYVDTMKAPYGRMIMCHCWADTREELFIMMDAIGVQLKWFQRPDGPGALPGMNASFEHCDISMSKRRLAIQHGAIETDRYGPSEHEARRKFVAAIDAGDHVRALRHLKMYCNVGWCRLRRTNDGDDEN